MAFGAPTPILRIFDEAKAKEFYCAFLGFGVDWEHRFGENFPLYMQVSSGACRLHLSEHYGDSAPGTTIRIEASDVDELASVLHAKTINSPSPAWRPRPGAAARPGSPIPSATS